MPICNFLDCQQRATATNKKEKELISWQEVRVMDEEGHRGGTDRYFRAVMKLFQEPGCRSGHRYL